MYDCPSCSTTFDNLAPGSDYRHASPDMAEGDVEILCPGCKRWRALDGYIWSANPVEEPDDDPMGYGQLTEDDNEPRKDFPKWA